MILTHIATLRWAFQLHYYLCFRTHRRRALVTSRVDELVSEICNRHGYHLLECQTHSDHVRTVLSLKPADAVAKVIQTIKTNSSRELLLTKPVWARGYLARSVGRTRIDVVKQYLDQQSKHHGYESRVLPPVYRYRATQHLELRSAHSSFDLIHHLVFATRKRKGVFTSWIGQALTAYWLQVATAREFVIDQVSVIPDHVHLIARILPRMSKSSAFCRPDINYPPTAVGGFDFCGKVTRITNFFVLLFFFSLIHLLSPFFDDFAREESINGVNAENLAIK